jgi:hypothetical protein
MDAEDAIIDRVGGANRAYTRTMALLEPSLNNQETDQSGYGVL